MVTMGKGERGINAYHLLTLPRERKGMECHLPLFRAGVLAVMLLQQVIRRSVKGQALVLFLEAIPGAVGTAGLISGRLYLKLLPSAHCSPPKLLTFRPDCYRSPE